MKKILLAITFLIILIYKNNDNNSDIVNAFGEISNSKIVINNYIKDYKFVDMFMNNNNLCLTYTKNDLTYFSIISDEKKIYTFKDTFNDYIFSRFSYSNKIVTNSNSLSNKNMISYNIKNNIKISTIVENPFSFNNVKSCDDYIYFYGGTEANIIYNSKKNLFINHSDITSFNPYSSNISIPLDSNSILISEGVRNELSLRCYNKDEIKWEKILPISSIYSQLSIISFKDFYIIYFDNKIIKLNKKDGENLKEFNLDSSNFKIYVINKKIYIIEKTASEKSIKFNILSLDTKRNILVEHKSIYFNDYKDVSVNVLKNSLIFKTDKTIKIYNLKNLKICKDLVLNSPLVLKNYIDDKTGNNILLMDNKYVFY